MEDQPLVGATDVLANRTFYSRRIGSSPLAPTLRADAAGNASEKLFQPPDPSAIYGAAKLVGTLGSRWSVGAISAFTGRNDIVVQDVASRQSSSRLADPAALYNVLRVQRALGGNAHLGLIATGVTRFDPGSCYPPVDPASPAGPQHCPSGDGVPLGTRCFHDAYVVGADGLWRSPSGAYVLAGQATGSLIENGPPRMLPDGTAIASGDRGGGVWARAAREGGAHLVWLAEYTGAGRRLDYNDAGYMARQNLHEGRAIVAYRTFEPGRLLLEASTGLSALGRWNLRGLDLGRTFEASTQLRFTSFWHVTASADVAPAHFDDREIGDGAALERSGWAGGHVEVTSDARRDVVVTVFGQGSRYSSGGGAATGQATLLLHVLPQLDLEVDPQLTYTSGEYRYASRGVAAGGDYLFGRLLARSLGATLRAAYTFTPRLSLQAYAQLFLASGHYSDLRAAARGGAGATVHLGDLTAPSAPAANPDFEKAALNVNLVLRWEYRLGSTIYLVYTRAQAPDVTLDPGQVAGLSLGSVARSAAVDVVLLKAAFWWSS
jgi:hypothetical protein